ncbi:MAG TPA: glycoside hydrolase family 3 N-terminal domain-containing protein [Lacibacter sp.]|nr:glycoside hydrolase family 3 N-terminal domain-containing protein [Lacibacter sp.]HMO89252.1 glycoside hydrolase family 3 N-terminal domain-containing protein [Lacibacter sp.]HMP88085.1 glycoside hydrolase family 3 N-terminal domain-containing protein [Lacibacter sp.]
MNALFSATVAFLLFALQPVAARAQDDSLDIKLGQLIIFGFYGTRIQTSDPVYRAVKEGKVGSILLYGRNIARRNAADSLDILIRTFQEAAPIPLFVSIDQEGGKVNRLRPELGFPPMPSAEYLGRVNQSDTTAFYAGVIAQTLQQLGINLNYAPVVDVKNPLCPVLGARERCFSADPEQIAFHAGIVVDEHHRRGVKTVLKHFPGHGNSLTDSHLGLTDVSRTWQRIELLPYLRLIRNNQADAIMTAHIVNTQLDESRLPATLSRRIMTGLLRDSLGFRGVIFSDDMQMKAISEQYKLEDAIFKAMDAGVDVLMFSNNIPGVADYAPANIHAIMKRLVLSGRISREQVDASFRRVMTLKQR